MQDLGRMCRYATRKNGREYDDLPYALVGRKLVKTLAGRDLEVMRKIYNFQGCYVQIGGIHLDHHCQERDGECFKKKCETSQHTPELHPIGQLCLTGCLRVCCCVVFQCLLWIILSEKGPNRKRTNKFYHKGQAVRCGLAIT